jgi:hypothetical protein
MTSIAGHERIIVAKSNYLSTIALSAGGTEEGEGERGGKAP